MTTETMIGVDLAKTVFQVHGASMAGQLKFRKRLSRAQFHKFMENQAPAIVVLEACGSAHYWARELAAIGLSQTAAPQYVRPFVKRQKNDAAVPRRSSSPLRGPRCASSFQNRRISRSRAVLFRGRERLAHQRTEVVNAL